MCTDYKNPIKSILALVKYAITTAIIALVFVLLPLNVAAQASPINVNISVMPPYTSSLYDYINTPNKIVITLSHVMPTGTALELYLKASIISENGIKVTTQEGFKPSEPIVLEPGKIYKLNTQNISDAFNINYIIIEGADLNDLLNGSGLPEDYYQICVQAFDYYTDQPLSADQPIGCSNIFNVTNLEPPMVITPLCGDTIVSSAIQTVQLSWNTPAGSLPGTDYHFEMVEIPEHSFLDPKEAFDVSAYPPFYEETTKLNSILLTIQKTILNPGYTYAFRVRALDPSERMHYRNNGYSEVCWFQYGSGTSAGAWGERTIQLISPKDCSTDSLLVATPSDGLYIGWRVHPFDPQNYKNPLDNMPGHQFRINFFDSESAQQPVYYETTDRLFITADPFNDELPFLNGNPYWVQISVEDIASGEPVYTSERCGFRYVFSSMLSGNMENRSVSGSIQYQFEDQPNSTYPIANTEIKMRCIYILQDANSGKQYQIPEPDVISLLGSEAIFPSDLSINPIASTITSNNGAFAFHFAWPENAPLGEIKQSFNYKSSVFGTLTGKLMRAMRIEVVSPYYSTPQALVLDNQTAHDMGEVITYVYSYELKATLTKGYKQNSAVTENMTDKYVYVFRKKKLPGLPKTEGDWTNSSMMFTPQELNSAGYYLVARAKAASTVDDQGNTSATFTIPRLIENLVNGDEYYWYAEGAGLGAAQPLSISNNINYEDFTVNASGFSGFQTQQNVQNYKKQETKTYFLNNAQSSSGTYAYLGGTYNQQNFSQTESYQGFQQNSTNYTNQLGFNQTGSAETNTLETAGLKISNTGDYTFRVETAFNVITSNPPMSGIKGRLVYEFPNNPGNARPLANRNISIVSCLVTDVPGQGSKIVKNAIYEENEAAFPYAKVLFSSTTDANGNFNFQFPNIEPENPDPTQGNFFVSTGKLNREASWISWESDPEENFRIVYEPKNVKVKRVLRIVVNDPSGLYMSPDDNLTIAPLETEDVGTLSSHVMSYCFKGGIGWDKPSNFQSIDPQTGFPVYNVPQFTMLEGVECYALRKLSEITAYQIPAEEGQNIIGTLDELQGFKIMAMGKSNSDGKFSFDNLLLRNCASPIYLYFKTTDMDGGLNFKPLLTNQEILNEFKKPVFLFNADYEYSSISGFSKTMEPRLPTLKGKVSSNVSAGKGVRGAQVKLNVKFKNQTQVKAASTDTAGYFDFAPLFVNYKNQGVLDDLQSIQIEVRKNGFHYMEGNTRKESYVNTFYKEDFEQGKQKVVLVQLYGNGSIKGRIVNEQGNPVDAYVQFLENRGLEDVGGAGTMSITQNASTGPISMVWGRGTFEIPAIPGPNRQLIIIPRDVTYFSDTIQVNVNESGPTNLGDIKVYERSHRLAFTVFGAIKTSNINAQLPIKDAKVELIGSTVPIVAYSNQNGKVNLSFKNVSETNLSLKVSGPAGSSYVPKVISFTNYESDEVVQMPNVFLEQGLTVKGKVLLDGKPTADAEVYLVLSYGQAGIDIDFSSQNEAVQSESASLFKARPNLDGIFEINTIPPELSGQTITLKAVYKKAINYSFTTGKGNTGDNPGKFSAAETQPTVIGEQKNITVPNASGNLTFNLSTYSDMQINDVWGFPLEITSLSTIPNSSDVYVSGRVKLDGYSPGFDPLEPLTFEVNNVRFSPSAKMSNGKPIGEPAQNEVYVDLKRTLKLKYAKSFNVKLNSPNNSLFQIVKNPSANEKGILRANVSIVDNSFQFPSSYLNFDGVNFNFCTTGSLFGQPILVPAISVFNSATQGNGNDVVEFNLCNLTSQGLAGDMNFKFINFNTRATAANSTIKGNEITLDATLFAKVKDAGDVKINIPRLVLKNNSVSAESGNTPIVVELKDGGVYDAAKAWKFEALNWRIDPSVGGIISSNCILQTGTINVPFKYFNLSSDFVFIDQPQTTQINLGGYPITFANDAKVSVGYNASCGGDKKGHWQLIFFPPPNGNVPAKVYGLPNLNNVALELETVSLLSNGENIFSVGTGASKMRLYNTVDFKPQTVSALPDGFVLSGVANFHIPRIRENIAMRLVFSKDKPVAETPRFDPIDLNFDGPGNIRFVTANGGQKFERSTNNERTFVTYGSVGEPGVLDPIAVKMTYFDHTSVGNIRTEIIQSPLVSNHKVKIGTENTRLENVTCRTKANQNDWDLFVFEGDLTGASGVSDDANKHMKFTVHGEIKGQHDGFKADGISYNFNGLQIIYQNGRMLGSLNMVNVPLGSSLVNGTANMLMDKDGWAFYSSCNASNVPAPEPCTLNMGLLIGDYPTVLPEMKNTVLKYAVKKEMPPTFNKGLKGFYMVGGRDLPLSGLDIDIDVIVASAYVRVPVAAVDAAYYLNFEPNNEIFGTAVSGRIRVEFGLGSITCTDLTGYGDATVLLGAEAESSGSLNLMGKADFAAGLKVSQGIPTPVGCQDAVDISVNVKGGFDFSTQPKLNVDFYLE
jgi:hypothetical protein